MPSAHVVTKTRQISFETPCIDWRITFSEYVNAVEMVSIWLVWVVAQYSKIGAAHECAFMDARSSVEGTEVWSMYGANMLVRWRCACFKAPSTSLSDIDVVEFSM